MRAERLRPILDALVPAPATDLPRLLVGLGFRDRGDRFTWDEIRGWLGVELRLIAEDADNLIADAVRHGDLRASLDGEEWSVRISPRAARAVLLRLAVDRLAAEGIDLDGAPSYGGPDRGAVLAMVPELQALALGDDPLPNVALYRQVLEGGIRA